MQRTFHIFLLLFFFGFLITSCSSQYPRDTPEAFGTSVFEALQQKDATKLRALFPNKEDMLNTIAELEISEKERQKILKETESNWEKTDERINRWIEIAFNEFEQNLGDDISKMTLGKIEVENARENDGLQICDIKVHFQVKDKNQYLDIRNAALFTRGWTIPKKGFRVSQPY